jgi:hypothetical protein
MIVREIKRESGHHECFLRRAAAIVASSCAVSQ